MLYRVERELLERNEDRIILHGLTCLSSKKNNQRWAGRKRGLLIVFCGRQVWRQIRESSPLLSRMGFLPTIGLQHNR